jgi:hypothetical protein
MEFEDIEPADAGSNFQAGQSITWQPCFLIHICAVAKEMS